LQMVAFSLSAKADSLFRVSAQSVLYLDFSRVVPLTPETVHLPLHLIVPCLLA
jgi:hypothetical protein